MILLENKLEMFNKIVYVAKEKECLEKQKEAKMRFANEVENKKKELQQSSAEIIKRRVDLANKRKYEILAKVSEDRRISELQKIEEIRGKLVMELEQRVLEFVKTDEYLNVFADKFKEIVKDLAPGNYILRTTAEDKSRLFEVLNKIAKENSINLSYEELDKKLLGGFTISDEKETYNIDASFKEKIEDRKYEIGKLLEFTLKKAGDQN